MVPFLTPSLYLVRETITFYAYSLYFNSVLSDSLVSFNLPSSVSFIADIVDIKESTLVNYLKDLTFRSRCRCSTVKSNTYRIDSGKEKVRELNNIVSSKEKGGQFKREGEGV